MDRTHAFALVVALAGLAGCGSNDALLTMGEGADPVTDESEDEAEFAAESALAAAGAALRDGDALSAYTIANQALRAGPPAGLAKAIRTLRAEARAALVAVEIVRLSALPVRDAVVAGSPVPVDVVFENRSAAEVFVPATATGSSTAVIVLELHREDYDVFGNVGSSDVPLRFSLPADLSIPPGGSRKVRFEIPPGVTRFGHQGFSVLHIGGTFRPVAVRVGETEFFDALPLASAPVRVFMANYEQLAEDPLGSLRKAIAKRSPAHILTAAELLPPEDRDEALALLVKAAHDDEPLAFVLDAAAERIRLLRGEKTDG